MNIKTERISLIDGLRGFSLFGILLANLLIFQYGIYGKDEIAFFDLPKWDLAGYHVTKILVETSFMPIFAFLFGYALILMMTKLQQRQLPVKRYFFRRFLALVVFGLLHTFFLWEGDILFTYGLMGIVLLLFLKRKAKTIFIWMVITFAILFLLSFGVEDLGNDILYSEDTIQEYLKETFTIYQNGSYTEIMNHRFHEDPMELGDIEIFVVLLLAPVTILPLFLLGMYAAHKGWLVDFQNKRKNYAMTAIILIPIGILAKLSPAFTSFVDFSLIGGSILAIGYIFLFAYLYSKFHDHRVMRAFEKVGKLSLSNYILQTMICTTVFYGYGLGLFAKMGIWLGILFGLAVYTIQVVASHWYMKRFKQGPLERVMRMFVYWNVRSKPKIEVKDVVNG
ncbi:DUF418 domain-containing protein [Gracilibacillus dipsosauri]|uniref:DUF418 domain-containing protein n=1 Tax=Gracilibacillus dipsosauri TaxID=178340 RepID=UPI0024093707